MGEYLGFKYPFRRFLTSHLLSIFLSQILFFYCNFANWVFKMTDGIRRAMQDIDLGVNDEPFVLPQAMVQQAAAENRFILVGRPAMPRRQNLRAIITAMPRTWGSEGIVRGRTTEGRRFKFVFPSEEAMETVLRRGPWAYAGSSKMDSANGYGSTQLHPFLDSDQRHSASLHTILVCNCEHCLCNGSAIHTDGV